MVTELTRETRYKRQLYFTTAMFLACWIAFATLDTLWCPAGVLLAINGLVWGAYAKGTRIEIEKLRLDISRVHALREEMRTRNNN